MRACPGGAQRRTGRLGLAGRERLRAADGCGAGAVPGDGGAVGRRRTSTRNVSPRWNGHRWSPAAHVGFRYASNRSYRRRCWPRSPTGTCSISASSAHARRCWPRSARSSDGPTARPRSRSTAAGRRRSTGRRAYRGRCRRCGTCRRVGSGSSAGTPCSPRWSRPCTTAAPPPCTPCTGSAASARPSSPSSTPTGTPPSTTWSGGSTAEQPALIPGSSSPGSPWRVGRGGGGVGNGHPERGGGDQGSAAPARGRWLVVFDNVTERAEVAGWLPSGPGHIIITSRSPAWAGVAAPLSVRTSSPGPSRWSCCGRRWPGWTTRPRRSSPPNWATCRSPWPRRSA